MSQKDKPYSIGEEEIKNLKAVTLQVPLKEVKIKISKYWFNQNNGKKNGMRNFAPAKIKERQKDIATLRQIFKLRIQD